MKNLILLAAVFGSFVLGGAARSRGEIVFDNTGEYKDVTFYTSFEYGDEIKLGGSSRIVTGFSFEYYSDFIAAGAERARVRFYENDGPGRYASPGTLIWESSYFPVRGRNATDPLSGFHLQTFGGLNVPVPDNFTWTVQFEGLLGTPGNRATLLVRDPIKVGSSFRDFWLNLNGNWSLYHFTNFDPPANFSILIHAVPEPGILTLAAIGGGLLFGQWTFRRVRKRARQA